MGSSTKTKSHFVITDTQVKPGVKTSHLEWAGKYIRDHKPDVIVQIGDFNDNVALSSYDKGKKAAENRRVSHDYAAAEAALDHLMAPWGSLRDYSPRLIFTEGNHEHREDRYEELNPEIDTIPKTRDLFSARGWKTYRFLQPVKVDGIYYCHFFCRSASGKVTQSRKGQPSAAAQAKREMVSSIAGHAQGLDVSPWISTADEKRPIRAIIAGSFYQHKEGYLTAQGNHHWHGCLHLHDVRNGQYDLEEVSLRRLKRMYG